MAHLSETLISSRRNPLVRHCRSLHQSRGRLESGLLLLEGTHLLQEVLIQGWTPERLVVTAAWLERHGDLLAALPPAVPVQRVVPDVLAAMATTDHPDGVVLTLPVPRPAPPAGTPSFLLVLERLQDPGNLGTLVRTARAAGVEQLWLAGGADPHQPKVLRASAGAALTLPMDRFEPEALPQRLATLRQAGVQVLATAATGGIPYWQLNWRQPTALLLGNEGAGLGEAALACADARVSVPHSAAVESLNVAVAAAPLLLERERQRLGGGART